MRKLSILLLFVMVASTALAQSQQELIQAYRNGTLSQEQINALRSQHQAGGDNVKRTRTVNIEAASTGNALVEEKAELNITRRTFPGGHDWSVWRRCIHDFLPMIFK